MEPSEANKPARTGRGSERERGLGRHRVAPHLPSLFYLPDYVRPDEEDRLLREVRASKAKWVQLSGRRLQNHGGVVHAKGLIPAPLPGWLQPLLTRLAAEEAAQEAGGALQQQGEQGHGGGSSCGDGGGGGGGGLFGGRPPNHVLVNSYLPGEGIMPHEDGPAYHPVVAILSLGAPAVLRFKRKDNSHHPVTANDNRNPTTADTTKAAVVAELSEVAVAAVGEMQQQSQPQEEQGHGAGDATAPPPSAPPPAPPASAASSLPPPPARPFLPPPTGAYAASLLLQPRSLVVFSQEAFSDCLHSIDEVHQELLDESVANLHMCAPHHAAAAAAAAAPHPAAAAVAAAAPTAPHPASIAAVKEHESAGDGSAGDGSSGSDGVTSAVAGVLRVGIRLPRGGERISLTVRRVAKVLPSILRPRGA